MKPKKIYKRFVFSIFILLLLNLGLFIAYFFIKENYSIVEYESKYKENLIIDDNISNREAEELNLVNFINQNPKNIDEFKENQLNGIILENYYRLPSENYIFINQDTSLKIQINNKNNPTIFIEQKKLNQLFDNMQIVSILDALVTKINEIDFLVPLKKIIISSSLIYFSNSEFYKNLRDGLKQELTIIQSLNLRWGDYVNYNDYLNYKASKPNKPNFDNLIKYIDEFWIENFDYTTPNSVLVGYTSSLRLTKLSINYYLSKGIQNDKIRLWINSLGYEWGYRDFEDNHLKNLNLNDQQAKLIDQKNIIESLTKESRFLFKTSDSDNVLEIQDNNLSRYLVYPSEEFIQNQINLAKQLDISGIIIF